MKNSQDDFIVAIKGIFFIVVMAYVGWVILGMYGLQEPIIETGKLILLVGGIAGGAIVIGWILYKVYNWREEKKMEKKRRKKAEEKRKQGKVKYQGNWMYPREKKARQALRKFDDLWKKTEDPQIKTLKKRAQKDIENGDFGDVFKQLEKAREEATRKVYRVLDRIKKFEPAKKRFGKEEQYQLNLHGWIKSKFPSAEIEETRRSSRPDITVGEIAIEVKGPTLSKDLATISDKVMRYMQNFEELIVVLFNVGVTDERYEDWKRGMKNNFPNVKIIRRDLD